MEWSMWRSAQGSSWQSQLSFQRKASTACWPCVWLSWVGITGNWIKAFILFDCSSALDINYDCFLKYSLSLDSVALDSHSFPLTFLAAVSQTHSLLLPQTLDVRVPNGLVLGLLFPFWYSLWANSAMPTFSTIWKDSFSMRTFSTDPFSDFQAYISNRPTAHLSLSTWMIYGPHAFSTYKIKISFPSSVIYCSARHCHQWETRKSSSPSFILHIYLITKSPWF